MLVGNGILKSCARQNNFNAKDWSQCLFDISKNKTTFITKESFKEIPYSLQATIIAPANDKERWDLYSEKLKTLSLSDNLLLKSLVTLGFDSILTTNYTYEIENCFHENYSSLKNKLPYAKTIIRKSLNYQPDPKYLLHTFNQFKNSPQIWHIHGELRRKSSIVLTHDEYSRLIHRLISENALNENKYVKFEDEVRYNSWLDYLLMSNLYIVGLGLDFSEFDLWWIINRRVRERAKTGRIVFFYNKSDSLQVNSALI